MRLVVLDVLGRVVRTVSKGAFPAGVHDLEVDTTRLAPGTYLVHLQAGASVESHPFTVVR